MPQSKSYSDNEQKLKWYKNCCYIQRTSSQTCHHVEHKHYAAIQQRNTVDIILTNIPSPKWPIICLVGR